MRQKTKKASFRWPPWVRAVIFACSAEGRAKRHYVLGEIWEASGETERAVAEYEAAVYIWPGLPKAYLAAGRCYLRLLDFERAKAALSRCLSLVPSDPEANLYQGVVSFYRDETEWALTYLQMAESGLGDNDPKKPLVAEYMRKVVEKRRGQDYGSAIDRISHS